MPNVNVVFNADTGRFVTNVQAGEKSVLKAAESVAKAKNMILESFEGQVAAAKEAGASQQELERIYTKSSERLASVSEENATRQIVAMERVEEKRKSIAAERANLPSLPPPVPAPAASEGHGLSDRQALSSVVRFGEGNPGIRSIENFLAMSPRVTAVAQSMAVLIGGAGLAGMLFDMGEKGYEAFEKIQHSAAEAIRAFDELHAKGQLQIDDLEIQNQKIQDQIDKISGHPNNGMATALLEAKKRADELLKSLQDDRKELEALFKEHSVGMFASMLTGVAMTGKQEANVLADNDGLQDKLRAANGDFEKATAGVTDPKALKAATQKRNEAVRAAFDSQIDTYRREVKRLRDEEVQSQKDAAAAASSGQGSVGIDAVNNSAKIRELTAVIDRLSQRRTIEQLSESIASGSETLGGLKQNKDGDEAGRKAAEQQMKAFELASAQLKAKFADSHGEMIAAEAAFWERIAHSADTLPQNVAHALDRYVAAEQQYQSQLEQLARKAVEQQKERDRQQVEAARVSHDEWEQDGQHTLEQEADFWGMRLLEAEKGSAAYLQALEKSNAAQKALDAEAARHQLALDNAGLAKARNDGRFAAAQLNIGRREGTVSNYDAAVQQAQINAQLNAAEQAALQKRLADANASHNQANIDSATAAITQNAADRQIQIMEDAANIAAATWQGALKNSLGQWVQDAQDSAKQVTEVVNQALSGTNQNLVNAMFGDKTDWSGMFKGVGKTLATDGLKHAEAGILGSFGIGKPDGSESSPLWVRMAGGVGSLTTGAGLFGGLFGHKDSSGLGSLELGNEGMDDGEDGPAAAASGWLAKAGKWVTGLFGGGRALGGDVEPGVAYDVGEMGRERFVPKTPGTIIPANALGGGNTYYSFQVGAGVSPEETDMRIRAALKEYHPSAVRASVQAVQDAQRRSPKR